MKRIIAGVAAVSFGAALISVDSFAADCSFLGRDPLTLRDTELFYRSLLSNKWESLDQASPDSTLGNQTITFAYVIQEKLDQRRSGVVILKSGRNRVNSDPAPRVVELVRNRPDDNEDGSAFDNGICRSIPGFGRATVSASSYDQYHDLGRTVSTTDQNTLDRFHYKYLGRYDRCRKTNDGNPDSKVPLVNRSNRGQFSFDGNIVGKTTNSQLVALLGPDAAYAGESEKLAEQRVEMKTYRVRKGLPTCVVFSLNVPALTGFIRINDLENLARTNLDYIRADEKWWSFIR